MFVILSSKDQDSCSNTPFKSPKLADKKQKVIRIPSFADFDESQWYFDAFECNSFFPNLELDEQQ